MYLELKQLINILIYSYHVFLGRIESQHSHELLLFLRYPRSIQGFFNHHLQLTDLAHQALVYGVSPPLYCAVQDNFTSRRSISRDPPVQILIQYGHHTSRFHPSSTLQPRSWQSFPGSVLNRKDNALPLPRILLRVVITDSPSLRLLLVSSTNKGCLKR